MDAGYNETFVSSGGSGRLTFGLEFANFIKPKEYGTVTHPVPMDIPRVRYEFGTRRVGSSPPVADAGPNQLSVAAGDHHAEWQRFVRSARPGAHLSVDPDHRPIRSPSPAPTAPRRTFTAAAGQTYSFRLTVKNTDNLQAAAIDHGFDLVADARPDYPVHGQPGRNSARSELDPHLGGRQCQRRHHQPEYRRRGCALRFRVGDSGADHHLHLDGHRPDRHDHCFDHGNGRALPVPATRRSSASKPARSASLRAVSSTLSWTTTGAIAGQHQRRRQRESERQHHRVADSDHHLYPDRHQRRRQKRDRADHRLRWRPPTSRPS